MKHEEKKCIFFFFFLQIGFPFLHAGQRTKMLRRIRDRHWTHSWILSSLLSKPVPNWDTDVYSFTWMALKLGRAKKPVKSRASTEFAASVVSIKYTCYSETSWSFIRDRHTRLITARHLHNVSLVRSFCKQIHHAGDWSSSSATGRRSVVCSGLLFSATPFHYLAPVWSWAVQIWNTVTL